MKNWDWEAIVQFMDDEIRERVHSELAPCAAKEFYDRYCEIDPEFDKQIRQTFSTEMIAKAFAE